VASVIFKITVTLLSKVGWVRFPHSPATRLAVVSLAALVFSPASLNAQQRDSARAGIPAAISSTPARVDSFKPPISPRRAFLTSLLLPGYGQVQLERHNGAMLFAIVEVFSIGMARKAAMDLHEAKRSRTDSAVATFQLDANGRAILDPATGLPRPATFSFGRFDDERINARRTHYEDWIAAIIFNHLFAGADAYVAANLWDFKGNVDVAATPRSARVMARVTLP